MRRVVVTGSGLVSPLGCGSELAWSRLLAARSGLAALPELAATLPARVAGIVPTKADDPDGGFDPDLVVPPKGSAGDQAPFALYRSILSRKSCGGSYFDPLRLQGSHRYAGHRLRRERAGD